MRITHTLKAEAIDQLQLENRDLRGVQEKLGRKERRARELKKKHASLGEQHTALLENFEAGQEQVCEGFGIWGTILNFPVTANVYLDVRLKDASRRPASCIRNNLPFVAWCMPKYLCDARL